MRFIFTSYSSSPEYDQPEKWLHRINGFTGTLEGLGRQHSVIGIERINYEGTMVKNGVEYHFVRLPAKTVYFPWRMHRLIKRLKPDVIFVNGFIFPLQIIQLRLKMGILAKIIVLHRSEKPFKGIKKYLQKLADKCVDAYLFTSLSFGDEWRSNINVDHKIHEVIQVSSRFQMMEKEMTRKITGMKGDPSFLSVGRLTEGKDPLLVIKAFLEFVSSHPESRLYMIYQTTELLDEIKSLLASSEHRKAVVLVGPVPHEQLLYWYNSADFFVTASHYEGSGASLSEAMSCGCIPITSDFISFRTMTGNGKCGLQFSTGDQNGLLEAFHKSTGLDMEEERGKVLQQFKDELSFEAIATKITKVVASL